jgi:hypothetical protein
MEPEAEPDLEVTEALQQLNLGEHSRGSIVNTNSNNHTTNHSTNFVLVGNSYLVSGTANRVTAGQASEATSSRARVPAAAASGFASSPPHRNNPPVVEPVAELLLGLRVEASAGRSRLPGAGERVGWRYYAVWNLPLFPDLHGIVVGPFPQVWSYICAHLRGGRYPGSGARLRRATTLDLVITLYQGEALFRAVPDRHWVWVVR